MWKKNNKINKLYIGAQNITIHYRSLGQSVYFCTCFCFLSAIEAAARSTIYCLALHGVTCSQFNGKKTQSYPPNWHTLIRTHRERERHAHNEIAYLIRNRAHDSDASRSSSLLLLVLFTIPLPARICTFVKYLELFIVSIKFTWILFLHEKIKDQ